MPLLKSGPIGFLKSPRSSLSLITTFVYTAHIPSYQTWKNHVHEIIIYMRTMCENHLTSLSLIPLSVK